MGRHPWRTPNLTRQKQLGHMFSVQLKHVAGRAGYSCVWLWRSIPQGIFFSLSGSIETVIINKSIWATHSLTVLYAYSKQYIVFCQVKYTKKPHFDCVLLFEDLTSLTFQKMRALSSDSRVAASWSSDGQIRYRLVDDPTIRRVSNVMDSVDKILS